MCRIDMDTDDMDVADSTRTNDSKVLLPRKATAPISGAALAVLTTAQRADDNIQRLREPRRTSGSQTTPT